MTNMTGKEALECLQLNQLIALGFQNKLPMKTIPRTTEALAKALDDLKVIRGLETDEYTSE